MASSNFPVAVIGMAVNLPAAKTCDEFWSMIVDGKESVGHLPSERAVDIQHVLHAFTSELVDRDDPFFTGSFFGAVDKFDRSLFQISEKEALYIEPEQRIFLEAVWEVLEDAGYVSKIRGTKTGVYVGNTVNKYKYILTDNHPSISHGNHSPFISARVSYVFDLKGPAMMVATGCSSSLLSVHLACQGLLSGDCDMAIAGGITLDLLPISARTDIWNQLGITGVDVKCRPFDRSANGIAKGEGCGAVMLKPLSKAIHDGDHVYGILEASTANQDGHSNGITAPHPGAQTSMLLQAWQLANITPDKISYFEAHGTGTELGDPIEISGITNAFKRCGQTFNCQSTSKIPIGSVKANVGHLADGAAGIVGLIKALLCYKNNVIPPSIHFKEPNPHINWAASPVFVNVHPINMVPNEEGAPIYISVSAFGLLGTNVHAVLRNPSPNSTVKHVPHSLCSDRNEIHFMVLAAKSKWSLCDFTMKMWQYFTLKATDRSCTNLKNVCYTINTGREQLRFQHRAIVYGSDWGEVAQSLKLLHCSLKQENSEVTAGYVSIYAESAENNKVILSTAKGQLILPFIHGKSISWDEYYSSGDESLEKVPQLPTYAFERVRYWPMVSDHKALNANYLTLEYGTSLYEQRENFGDSTSLDIKAPMSEDYIESTLQAALNDVLNLNYDWREHAEENLFSYGLDSLISTQINMFIKNELGCSFSIKGFHLNPTYQGIKLLIQEELHSGSRGLELAIAAPVQSLVTNSVSFAQQRLWVMQELTGNHCVYNATNCLKITGNFHASAFVAAVNSVLSSHDAFHIVFSESNGKPTQRLKSELQICIKESDLSALGDKAHDTVLEYYGQDYSTSFDLRTGPLVRCVLYHLPDNTHYYTMVVHHIIFDGWSHFLFYNELWDKYTKIVEGNAITSQLHLPLYVELAGNECTSAYTDDLEYWKKVLSGNLPLTTLPGDRRRPAVFTHSGGRLMCTIDDEVVKSLQALFGGKHTMFMVLLASVFTLIHSFSGEEDLIIGSPIAGRTRAKSKHVIGCFVNTLALRLHVDSSFDFEEVLEKVSNVCLEALDHQSLPFDYIVSQLNLPRDPSITPVFSVNVCYHNTEIKGEHVDPPTEIKVERVLLHNDTAKWDLYFDFLQEDHGMTFTLEYYRGLFSDNYAKHILDTLLSLFRAIIEQPSLSLSELQSFYHGNAISVLHGNASDIGIVPLPVKLLEILKRNSSTSYILDFNGESHTYGEVLLHVERLSVFLRKSCMLAQQSKVGLLLDVSLDCLIALLACFLSGLVYVPLSKDDPRYRLEHICMETELKAVLFSRDSLTLANHLLWSCKTVEVLICVANERFQELEDKNVSVPLMDTELWHSVATSASNDVEGGGWKSSYTGEFMSTEEMNEYSQNVLLKLRPYLSLDAHVLEIGCASGLTTKVLAPFVSQYVATDISQAMIDRLKEQEFESGNVEAICVSADQIHIDFNGKLFDIIILNSVIHCFPGHSYLQKVFAACEDLLSENGIIFIGDIMDFELKEKLIHSLKSYKARNPSLRVKTEWENELFLTRDFMRFLCHRSAKLNNVSVSKKIYTISNELTDYRFDAVYSADKNPPLFRIQCKMYTMSDVMEYADEVGNDPVHEIFLTIVKEVEYNDQAYILFTSGTTGTPKGVVIGHEALLNYVQWASVAYDFDNRTVIPLFSPLTFDFTVTSIFPPLLSGSTVVMFKSFQQSYSEMTSCQQITAMKLSPLQLDTLLATADKPLSASTFIIGGEELTPILLKKLKCNKQDRFLVWNEYGPTEATVGCIVKCYHSEQLPLDQNELVSIGRPIDNVTISVVQKEHIPVITGGIGTLCIGGKCLCSDLIGSEVNRNKFIAASWGKPGNMMLITDDIAQVTPDASEIFYYGRDGDTAKVNDIRVDLVETQKAIEASSFISSAWVCTFSYKSHTYIGAAMIPKMISKEDFSLEEMIATSLIRTLPRAYMPKLFITLSQPPVNANGKRDTPLLKRLFVSRMDSDSKKIYPRSSLRTDIAKLQHIWQSVLPVNYIPQPEENFFFELRGDSLQAIYLVRKLRDEGYQVDITDIFKYPTISQLSLVLGQRSSYDEYTKSEPVATFRPTPIIEEFLIDSNSDQFALPALLHFTTKPETCILIKALRSLMNKHMSLHSRFEVKNEIAQQIVTEITEDHTRIIEVSIDKKNEVLIKEADFLALCNKLEQSHSLSEGILLNAAIINYCTDPTDSAVYVLIVVHHIAIDIASWQQILSDLALSLQILSENSTSIPTLPTCRTPFSAFCGALHSASFETEIPYWKNIDTLSHDSGTIVETWNQGTYKSARWCSISCTASAMLSATAALQCSDEVLLLTMLGRSMAAIHGKERTVITLESHGRQLPVIDSTDTVGWCTSKFPFVLHTPVSENPVSQVKLVQENKNKIPNQGLGFGVLKSTGKVRMHYPKTMFVFQGYLDTIANRYFDGGVYKFEQVPWLEAINDELTQNNFHRHQSDTLQFGLEVISWIYQGELKIGCLFDSRALSQDTVQKLLDLTVLNIKSLANNLLKTVKIGVEVLSTITITPECTNVIKQGLLQHGISVNEFISHPPEQIVQQLNRGHSELGGDNNIVVIISRFQNSLLAEDFVQACTASTYLKMDNVVLLNAESTHNSVKHSMNTIKNSATVCTLPEYIANSYDVDSDIQYGMPFTQVGYVLFGLHIARVIRGQVFKTKYKVIVVDADYTLWDGECAEGNVTLKDSNIKLHHFLLNMKQQGMLLVVLSKNSLEDVEGAFEHTMKGALTVNDFITVIANWRSKVDNIRDIARQLNLGLDSFVFIDDNFLECEQMLNDCPEVLTLQFPPASQLVSALLDNLWALDNFIVSTESATRTEMYKSELKRQENLHAIADDHSQKKLHMLLSTWNMKIRFCKSSLHVLMEDGNKLLYQRASELLFRTNQFKLNDTNVHLDRIKLDRTCWLVCLEDRYGSYGMVSVLLTTNNAEIEQWVISCRALGRQIENVILKEVCRRLAGLVLALVNSTGRNIPCLQFLQFLNPALQTASEASYMPIHIECLNIPSNIYEVHVTSDLAAFKESVYPRTVAEAIVDVSCNQVESTTESLNELYAWIESVWSPMQKLVSAQHNMFPIIPNCALLKGSTSVVKGQSETTSLESCLKISWMDVLHTSTEPTESDDFLHCGGNSFTAVFLVSKLRRLCNIEITIMDLLQTPQYGPFKKIILSAPVIKKASGMIHNGYKDMKDRVLSSSQQRMVIMQLTSPESSAYTETVAIKSQSTLKPAEVFKALAHIHPILMLRIKSSKDSYLMYIDEELDYNPDVIMVPDLRTAEGILSDSIPAMNILCEALVKFRYLKTENGDIVLAVHLHHVLVDEITLTNLSHDLLKLANMNSNLLSSPPVEYGMTPYATFVDEKGCIESEQCIKDGQFWKSYFTNLPPTASLTILPENECTWSNTASYQAKHKTLSMPLHDKNQVLSYCQHIGITPYRYFLACTIIVLHRYLGVDTVTLAIPVTTRTDENEQMDGLFVNTVMFTARIDTTITISEHIEAISDNWLAVQSHSQYPLDQVVKMLWQEHGTSSNSFCCTMFNYSCRCCFKNEIRVFSRHAKMPLSIDIIDGPDSLGLSIEWAPELVSDSIVERLASSLMELYCTAFSLADQPIHSIDLLPASENSLIKSFQSSGYMLPKVTAIINVFEHYVDSYPNEVAVICEDNSLTYTQVNNIASNLAHELLSRVEREKLKAQAVIILMSKDEYAIASILGVWKTGGYFIPISISSQSSLKDILQCMTPAAIILNTSQESVPVFEEIQSATSFPIINILDVPQANNSKCIQSERNVDGIAYVIRTSGSTGKPKQCNISQRSISILSNAWKIEYKMDKFDISVLQWAPLSFDVFIGDLVRSLISAPGKLVICPDKYRLDVKHVLNLISTNRISMCEMTPQFGFQVALSASKKDLESLHLFILGSDVLQSHIYKKIRCLLRTDQRLINSYGMTEATIDSSYYEGDALPVTRSGAVPIGRPLPGVTFHILDSRTLQVSPIGTVGELFISGDILASGDTEIVQLKHTEVKALKTGDAACWLPCGNVDLLGRLDNMVKLRGFRICTAEIENKIAQHVKEVKDACVIVNGHSKDAEFLCAFLVLNEDVTDTKIDRKDVHNQLRNFLPYYMLPDFVSIVQKIPLTANGKVDSNSLPSLPQLLKSREMISSNDPVISPTMFKLRTIFASSLGLPDYEHIDCDQTFMEQGANSLILIQFSTMIATETTFNIGIADIFSYPSISALADFVDSNGCYKVMNDDFCTALKNAPDGDIAITGLGLRLPGNVMSLPQLWEVLQCGKDVISDFPNARANDVKKCLHSTNALTSTGTFQGAFLEYVNNFDHQFFKLAPGEAKFMSPEQRLFLQVATEALLEGRGLSNSKGANIGVFVGLSEIGYSHLEHPDEPITIAGLMPGMVATRVAYQWDLKGPTMLVDTACSSSLMALKLACESIKRKECKGALVGGISLVLYPSRTGVFGNASILSPDFHCKPFDEHANGTAVGEGVLCVYLEPLAEAEANNKHVYGIIKATTSNSVGHGNGITAPSAISQAEVIESAIAAANIKKSDVCYIECHGTGTKIGDKIELSALASVFSGLQIEKLPIGSVKSIFGHLDAAAGMLGVFKVITSMMFKKMTPMANFSFPHAELANSCLSVVSCTEQWKTGDLKPRIAGVSAFGLTGTNCHTVISEFTNAEQHSEEIASSTSVHLLFSGANLLQIKQQFSSYLSYIKFVVLEGNISLSHLCHTVVARLKEIHALTTSHNQFRMVTLAQTPESTMKLLGILDSCSSLDDMVKLAAVRNDVYVFSQESQESSQKYPAKLSPFDDFLSTGTISLVFPSHFQQAPGVVVPMYQEFPHWLDPANQHHQTILQKKLSSLFRDMITDTRELIRTLSFEPTQELLELQNQFCSSIIVQYFLVTELAPYMKNCETITFSNAFILSNMLVKYEMLFFVMIRELYNNNLLVATGTNKSVHCLDSFQFKCQQMLNCTPQLISEKAIKQYPQWADCFRFPLYCSRKLPEVLQGHLNPLSVIYPKGDLNFMYQFDKLGDPLGDVYYNMYMQLIASHAKMLSNERKQVKILEVGAGVGYVTRQLLPKLQNIANVEYWFTDLGKSFVENAKNLFKQYEYMMRFATFDITKSPSLQGIIDSFDIVISYNVIHTTESILKSVLNLKTCLSNDGSLFIIESAKNETWATLAWGILDGWWFFKDYDLRPFEPMLEPEKWEKLLMASGFGSVYSCPINEIERKHVEKFLFLCSAKQLVDDSTDACSQGWWETDIDQFDPVEKYNEVDKEDKTRTVPSYTNKLQVYEELNKIWSEVLGIDNIASDDSFSACGGESLLAIQMMNHVRKQLGYQLEIADTYGYPTLGTLAAYIAQGLGIIDPLDEPIITSSESALTSSTHSQHLENKTLLMFPGQGVQKRGMFQTMQDSSEARVIFQRAESIIGCNILDLCIAEGKELEEKLKSTEFVQVALLTGCIAKMEQIKKERPELIQRITHVAGLSVGEFAALVFAEVINFEDALQLVQRRGQAMENEVKHSPTGMISIFGPESCQLQSYLTEYFPDMKISTFLGDNQHTVAGSSEDCDLLLQSLSESVPNTKDLNIIDVRRLRVAGAFHSPYMNRAAAEVNPIIQSTHFSKPVLPVIMNVDGNVASSPEDIKHLLQEQLIAPVNWKQSILTAHKLGVQNFVEVSPGRVLSSIVKKRIHDCRGCNVEFIGI